MVTSHVKVHWSATANCWMPWAMPSSSWRTWKGYCKGWGEWKPTKLLDYGCLSIYFRDRSADDWLMIASNTRMGRIAFSCGLTSWHLRFHSTWCFQLANLFNLACSRMGQGDYSDYRLYQLVAIQTCWSSHIFRPKGVQLWPLLRVANLDPKPLRMANVDFETTQVVFRTSKQLPEFSSWVLGLRVISLIWWEHGLAYFLAFWMWVIIAMPCLPPMKLMLGIQAIKMVMNGGWFMTLLYPYYS